MGLIGRPDDPSCAKPAACMLKSIDITGPCPTAPAAPDRAVSQQSRYGPSSAAATTGAAPVPETYADISAVMGTWRLQSYVREVLATGERFNQFGEDPDGYIGYAPDDRMDAIWWPTPGRSRSKPRRSRTTSTSPGSKPGPEPIRSDFTRWTATCSRS